jgi:ketosteroid isomerase-like protein
VDWSDSVSPYRGVYRGTRRVASLYRDLLDAWTELSWDPEDLPGDRVIVTNYARAVGHGSRVRVDARGHHLWHVRDGKAASVRPYPTREQAEAAAGPEPQADD